MYLNSYRGILIPILLLWLTACSTQLPVAEKVKLKLWQANRDRILKLDKWKLNGRIGITVKRDAWSASLRWQQIRRAYRLWIIAPFGQGSFELQGNDHGVTLYLAKNKTLHADTPEALLRKTFGWSVPVMGLSYWIRGLPEPNAGINGLSLDDKGRLHTLEQSGWQITYARYSSHGKIDLPGKIQLQNGTLKLRLVIRNWVM